MEGRGAPTIPESGDALVKRMLSEYGGWAPTELVALRMSGQQLDRVVELRAAIASADDASKRALVRAERAAMASFTALIRSLRLREET